MKKMLRLLRPEILALGILSVSSPTAFADDRDSNADAVHSAVAESSGALIRVPMNAQGQEQTDAAELRVFKGTDTVTSGDLPSVWERSTPMATETAAPADSSTDSSTWWGWNRWGGHGWRAPYYYYNYYTPYYNYYGNYYNYYGNYYNYYPYYYNSYNPYGPYYGSRYYYYPRYY